MFSLIKVFLVTFLVFILIDLLWLGVIAKNIYRSQMGHLMKSDINWTAALIFYAIFICGILYFALIPSLDSGQAMDALLKGALFGFFAYATYDLTNLAVLKDYPLSITIIDMIWGTSLGGLTSFISYWAVTTFSLYK